MALDEYKRKRNFKNTPEPGPELDKQEAFRFVVQKHRASRLHYDFRLEMEGVLKSWAVPKGPSLDPKDKRLAVQVEDHDLSFGDFEGRIPEGQYGAGEVIVWDCGVYSPDEGGAYSFHDRATAQQRLRDELAAGKVSLCLLGEKVKGSYALVRTKDKSWLLLKHRDPRSMRAAMPWLAQVHTPDEDVAWMRDVIFAISSKAYSPDVVQVVRESAQRGAATAAAQR